MSQASSKTPVAIRITRPYATEDEFLAQELDTVSRSGVTLVGAQSRPEGVVLRFEIALSDGTPILRGEGRVVGYKAAAHGTEPGLALRFTRLDSRSKALVDKAGALRDTRAGRPPKPPPLPKRASARAPAEPQIPAAADSVPIPISEREPISTSSAEEPEAASVPDPVPVPDPDPDPASPTLASSLRDEELGASVRASPTLASSLRNEELGASDPVPAQASEAAEPEPTPTGAAPVRAARSGPPPAVVALSVDRNPVLERLRSRAAALAPERIDAILREGRERATK